ncbi:acyltransferase family protein [Photorhabdus temperata]|uniref:Acyltransferase 3 domain-containing protein n=1 Tax=Photorhabdus temperata J3 TaxID=1389415 RepID=U7R4U5_PHOTE|nr:hypothetical protein O185_04065 [Photorhabdus temperata J3]
MNHHLLSLTSLRFFAAFFVLLSHLGYLKDSDYFSWLFVYNGYIGVTFFFILSGFVLAYSYEEKMNRKEISKRNFFVARIARIYPLHILTFIIFLPIP